MSKPIETQLSSSEGKREDTETVWTCFLSFRFVWSQNSSASSSFFSLLLSSLPFASVVRRSRGLYCRGHVDSISPFSRLGNKTLASIIYLHYRYFTPTRTRHVFMGKLFSIISRIWTRWEIRPTDRYIIRGSLEKPGEAWASLASAKISRYTLNPSLTLWVRATVTSICKINNFFSKPTYKLFFLTK